MVVDLTNFRHGQKLRWHVTASKAGVVTSILAHVKVEDRDGVTAELERELDKREILRACESLLGFNEVLTKLFHEAYAELLEDLLLTPAEEVLPLQVEQPDAVDGGAANAPTAVDEV